MVIGVEALSAVLSTKSFQKHRPLVPGPVRSLSGISSASDNGSNPGQSFARSSRT